MWRARKPSRIVTSDRTFHPRVMGNLDHINYINASELILQAENKKYAAHYNTINSYDTVNAT